MPCWYFERKEIRNSPSYQDGIDQTTENRYRREGARLILDAGTKLGLRYDTCATGVVYFHRFYMSHSFKEFPRYVISSCCLFLAGKVEETPKKCKDIIRTVQILLSPENFQTFGDDPREEVMTMERVLLRTIKFDLQVEHPYSFLLNYAKQMKSGVTGDKEKIQKMTQMAWTFINDSLCTTLSLQWEPEIIAVSLMYLASRLTKHEPTDWACRVPGSKSKWWEDLIEGNSMELMEDVCHQVLDLYSAQQKQEATGGVSPPPGSVPRSARLAGPRDTPPPPPPPPSKRSRNESPVEALGSSNSKSKKLKQEREKAASSNPGIHASRSTPSKSASPNLKLGAGGKGGRGGATPINPYVSSSMYSSSFMSQEGSQSIQSLLTGGASAPPAGQYPPAAYATPAAYAPAPASASAQYQPPSTPTSYPAGVYPGSGYSAGYPSSAPSPYCTPYTTYSGVYAQSTPVTYSSTALPSPAALTTALPPSSYTPSHYAPPPPGMAPPAPQGYPYPAQPPRFLPPGFPAPQRGPYGSPNPMGGKGRGAGRYGHNQNNLAPVRQISDRGGMR